MKCFTGDESGLVKSIIILPKVEKPKKRAKRQDQEQVDKEKKEVAPEFIVNVFGKVNKEEAVQKLAWAVIDGQKQLVVARKSGKVQFMCPDTGKILKEFHDPRVGTGDEKQQSNFVGVHVADNHLATCSSTGDFSYTPLSSSSTTTTHVAKLGSNLSIMRFHPTKPYLFAVGGKDHDLCVYDVLVLTGKKAPEPDAATEKTINTAKYKREKPKAKGLVFQAKNVKNDHLDLQVPVWIRDLQFVNEEGTEVAVATQYHQIRLYHSEKGRRPVLNKEIGKVPIISLNIGKDYRHVIFTDTTSTMGALDLDKGEVVGRFKGLSGAVTDTQVTPHPSLDRPSSATTTTAPLLASVSLDRFLRVHEMTTVHRQLQHKVYLKQRLTAVIIDDDYQLPVPEAQAEEDKEDDSMWEAMEKVDDKGAKRKRA
ncbi:WD40-repeat-containing domain protein [Radiomyces spectabilis]|uniref:WD40-repeat-containing domain protein n=1 Tax=Radiomyces spectabilis TaxID=64574 RepID=UPI00221F40E9|nr:WD40-repeat-containing domain protein [Radiomyces spectabilis]KAI8364774.1 WD40-repeat-containing domain protein [Radiomyces spectabilis]